jgi:hypothetical protein
VCVGVKERVLAMCVGQCVEVKERMFAMCRSVCWSEGTDACHVSVMCALK